MPLFAAAELRNAARALARTPMVTLSAVACLALGIGATTAIASAVSRALLQSLPFREPEALVAVHRVTPQSGPMGTWPNSAPNYADLARETRTLSGLAALTYGTALVTLRGEAVQASQVYVTGNFFSILGARPALGRFVEPVDDRPDQPIVAVLSWEFWNRRMGADPAVVGSIMLIDGEPTTITGIAPRDFRVPHGGGIVRGAALATRIMGFMLYGVSPLDPVTWVAATALLAAAGLLATWVPARRAVGVDPVRAIQAE